jgi:hypothetical protein
MHNATGLVFSLLEQGRLEHASATEGNQGGADIDDKIVEVERPILRVGFNNADPYDVSILREVTISPTWPGDRNHSNAMTLTVST